MSRKIAAVEEKVGHKRTIVVGDFNMNPFETGMISAEGLHAVMDRRDLADRRVRGQVYTAFYNPMWGKFGDLTEGASGTYYYGKGELVRHPWNMFDQVLIRPELAHDWKSEQVRILDNIGSRSLLLENGRPDSRTGSDHLPNAFAVDCE